MSQFYIVFRHIFLLFIAKESDEQIYKAIQMPLHIGVIVFVLLSGYFSIKPSSKKLIKLLSIFVVYTMPETIYTLTHSDNTMKTVHSLFILSYTHFWFIKTYLFLFLVSPMLNFYWDNLSKAQRIYMTAALGFVAVYMATTHGDKSMLSGKNLVNFMFLYYVGRLIWQYKEKWQKIGYTPLAAIYVVLNAALVLIYLYGGTTAGKAVWALSFPYSSPVLLLNSLLVFFIIGKMHFHSRIVNYLAASSLAIYLIHGCRPYVIGMIGQASLYLYHEMASPYMLIAACALLALVIICVCIAIDKMLTPVWSYSNNIGSRIYNKLGF